MYFLLQGDNNKFKVHKGVRSIFERITPIFMHLHFHAMYESCYITTKLIKKSQENAEK
jgi:hypothetical protein